MGQASTLPELEIFFISMDTIQKSGKCSGAKRVSTVLKIDDRRDRTASMSDKVRAVGGRLKERE